MFVLAYNNTAGNNQVSVYSFKNIFFRDLKLKITISKLMVEIFMISQLMFQLKNTMKSQKYQQDKVMITQLVVY